MQGCMNVNNQNVKLCPGLQQLKKEHVGLFEMLNELNKLSNSFLCQTENITNGFKEITDKLSTFYKDLAPHSEKEEEVLFKMMGKYLPKTGGPIQVMEAEHERARQLIENYFNVVNEDSNSLSSEDMKQLARSVVNVHHILTDHFAKEENVLFPMAERMFSEEEKQILADKLIP